MGRGTAQKTETSRPGEGGRGGRREFRRKEGRKGNKDCGEVSGRDDISDFSP